MRIAFITNTFYPEVNGVVTSVINASKELAKRDHKICIFTTKHKEKTNLGENIEIKEYPGTGLLTKYPNFRIELPSIKFLKDLRKFNPNIIHVHTPTIFAFQALFFAKKNKITIIGTYHTLVPDFLEHFKMPYIRKTKLIKKFAWFYTNLFYNNCNLVITPSKAMKQELIKNGVNNKITALSNGINTRLFNKAGFNKIPVFLYVGRISYEKNIDIIINAFKILQDKNIKSKLIVVGLGPDEQRLKKISSGYNIEFKGPLFKERLAAAYSDSDAYVTASTVETEGITILEAMASGLPVIGVDKLAIPGLIKNNKNGFVVEPFNYKEMAIAMEKLILDIKKRKRFGAESLRLVKKFSINKVIDNLERIYMSINICV